MANHSATHLMSFALENVLGEIRQQGSMVGDGYFTFDFTCRKVCKCYVFLVDSDVHRCLICTNTNVITLPVGAVVKYCDECICLCVCLCVCASVCLSDSISPEPHTRSLPNFLCMLPMAVAQSSGRVTKSQGEGAIFGVFLPIDNAL